MPALVGRGQTLLALKRDTDALAAFEAALAADASLADVRRRVDVLRFRSLQDVIEAGRAAAAAGRLAEARAAYQRALQASPDSAFLHRELGLLERKQGNAMRRSNGSGARSSSTAPTPCPSFRSASSSQERRDFAGAEAAYRRAADIEPSADLTARSRPSRRARARRGCRRSSGLIAEVSQITRGELAALIGVRLEDVVRAAPAARWSSPTRSDTGRQSWITAGRACRGHGSVREPHLSAARRITRGDLAAAVSARL